MTTVKISEPALLDDLLADLHTRPDMVADVVGPDVIEVTILGSYNSGAMRLATFLRIRAWEAGQRACGVDVHVELEND
jgi:hypothetical protein